MKSAILILRIDDEEKHLIADAAATCGESITALVRRASLAEAKKALTEKKTKENTSPAYPNLRIRCATCYAEAKQGGANGYEKAGRYIATFIIQEDAEAWKTGGDKQKVVEWFSKNYPDVLKSVPKRRQKQFVKGIFHTRRNVPKGEKRRGRWIRWRRRRRNERAH
jgi:hypothetical protein